MDKRTYLDWCREIPGAVIDQPFTGDFDTYIVRRADSGKWFAALLEHNGRQMVNLKCDPIESEFLQSVYQGIEPGYHMNKTHWISVYFESDVPDDLLKQLTQASFKLTDRRKRKQAQRRLNYGESEK